LTTPLPVLKSWRLWNGVPPLLNNQGAIIMRSVTTKFWNSALKLLGLFDRVINTADAIMETAEDAATRFRDEEREAVIKTQNLRV
jgi:hypothetical protein